MGKIKPIFVGSFLFLVSGQVHSALFALEYGSSVNTSTQEVSFFIEFNEAPDFFTLDSAGRQADSFQYFIDIGADEPYVPLNFETLIRGEEIHADGDIKFRDRLGNIAAEQPQAGGWGPVRGAVPYTLTGTILTFTTHWSNLNDDDGVFTYMLTMTEFGGTSRNQIIGHDTDYIYGLSGVTYNVANPYPSPPTPPPPPIPIPASIWLFGTALVGLVGFSRRRKAA